LTQAKEPYSRKYGTVSRMKTTVQIPDSLVARAKGIARREGTTLAALVEEGLRGVVKARGEKLEQPFVLRDASIGGSGLSAEFAAGWDAVRRAIYEGHGG
jgi:hypothetical protein